MAPRSKVFRDATKRRVLEAERLAREITDPGQTGIGSFREGETDLPSLLVPKAMMHGIL